MSLFKLKRFPPPRTVIKHINIISITTPLRVIAGLSSLVFLLHFCYEIFISYNPHSNQKWVISGAIFVLATWVIVEFRAIVKNIDSSVIKNLHYMLWLQGGIAIMRPAINLLLEANTNQKLVILYGSEIGWRWILLIVYSGLFIAIMDLIIRLFSFNEKIKAQAIQSQNDSLLVEKDQLIEVLSQEKAKSERANEAKSQFLANVSHEIRTPLHGLIGLTSMTLKSSMSEDIRKSLDKVLYSSKALLVILNDILDFSKIEAGVIEINNEPFKMKHLMDDIKDLFLISATEKGIELRFDIDPATPEVMIGDFYKLRQVLFNLVGNAIKFTQQGYVEIRVRIDQIEAESVRVTMTVKDTGIGISEKDLQVIFEPFNQLDNTHSRRYDGVGLGLPITKNLLLKMGSELMMKSQPGVGTESTFAIPLRVNDRIPYKHRTLQASSLKEESSLPYASLAGRHVLVAEDNPINIEVVRQYLNFLKIESHFVTDGQQCIEALKNNRYECVLMDIQMPNFDGMQATYQIRLMDGLKDIPIIGLSAGVAESDREKGLASGMNDFLAKPFEVEDLAKTLMKYLC